MSTKAASAASLGTDYVRGCSFVFRAGRKAVLRRARRSAAAGKRDL